jgi:hypothetical protein
MAIFRCVYFIFVCLKDSASLLFFLHFFFHVITLCMFPSVGWVKYEVLLFSAYAIFGNVICVFYLLVFFPLFSFDIFVVSLCVCVCLLALSLLFVCSVLLSVVYFV